MAHLLAERVKETTTTTGTGTLALLGAVTQFRAFSAVLANNDTTLYAIVGQTGAEWEVGFGTWLTGNSLARTTVLASSNAGAAVNFSAGTKDVFITLTPSGQWPGLLLVEGAVINWDNGDVTITQAGNTLTIAGGTLIAGTGSATVASFKIPAGTLLTTPEVGAFEVDATNYYGTTDAGNRGYIPIRHFIRADATRTLPNDTNENAIFNSPANGRLALEIGAYLFEGMLWITGMSATSGNGAIDILGAGDAVCAAWLWHAWGADANTPQSANANVTGSWTITQQSIVSVVSAAVGTAVTFSFKGTMEVTTAGTIIPSITLVTAAAAVVAIGSYMSFERIGSASAVSVGQWD